jgi:hypothetical protein
MCMWSLCVGERSRVLILTQHRAILVCDGDEKVACGFVSHTCACACACTMCHPPLGVCARAHTYSLLNGETGGGGGDAALGRRRRQSRARRGRPTRR